MVLHSKSLVYLKFSWNQCCQIYKSFCSNNSYHSISGVPCHIDYFRFLLQDLYIAWDRCGKLYHFGSPVYLFLIQCTCFGSISMERWVLITLGLFRLRTWSNWCKEILVQRSWCKEPHLISGHLICRVLPGPCYPCCLSPPPAFDNSCSYLVFNSQKCIYQPHEKCKVCQWKKNIYNLRISDCRKKISQYCMSEISICQVI